MALVYIRGRREPVSVANIKAILLRKSFLDRTVSRDTPIMAGNWSGTLSEVRSIETDDEREVNRQWREPTWNDAQLAEFQKEALEHRKTARERLGEGKEAYWAEFYLHAKGATVLEVVDGPFGKTLRVKVRGGGRLYADLSAKVSALGDWEARKGFGRAQRDAEYEKMAQEQKSLLDNIKIQ